MRRSSADGQTEVSALVAVMAVGLGLSLYAGVLVTRLPSQATDGHTATVADRATDLVTEDGVVRPDRLDRGLAATPAGTMMNLTLHAGGRVWTAGPRPPSGGSTATARVTVRVDPGLIRPGQLRVRTWQ